MRLTTRFLPPLNSETISVGTMMSPKNIEPGHRHAALQAVANRILAIALHLEDVPTLLRRLVGATNSSIGWASGCRRRSWAGTFGFGRSSACASAGCRSGHFRRRGWSVQHHGLAAAWPPCVRAGVRCRLAGARRLAGAVVGGAATWIAPHPAANVYVHSLTPFPPRGTRLLAARNCRCQKRADPTRGRMPHSLLPIRRLSITRCRQHSDQVQARRPRTSRSKQHRRQKRRSKRSPPWNCETTRPASATRPCSFPLRQRSKSRQTAGG